MTGARKLASDLKKIRKKKEQAFQTFKSTTKDYTKKGVEANHKASQAYYDAWEEEKRIMDEQSRMAREMVANEV